MTTIRTASYRTYTSDMGLAVVTSRGLPKFRPEAETWPRLWLVTPGAFLDAEPDEFARLYLAQLDRHGPAKVCRALEHIARQNDAESLVLCCFERSPTDCHRGLLAEWALTTAGLKLSEVP